MAAKKKAAKKKATRSPLEGAEATTPAHDEVDESPTATTEPPAEALLADAQDNLATRDIELEQERARAAELEEKLRLAEEKNERLTQSAQAYPQLDAKSVTPEYLKTLKPGRYWCGLRDDCPRFNIDLAGVGFPRVTMGARKTEDGQAFDQHRPGKVVYLVQEDLDGMAAAAGRMVIRITNPRTGKSRILDKTSPRYRPQEGDVAKSDYCLLAPMPEG